MTQKILSASLSPSPAITFHTKLNDHDVEPSRGRSSLTTGPIHPINPPLPSPYRRPSPRRLLRTNQTCLCPPLAGEVSNASRHRDTLRQLPAPSAEAALHPAVPTNRGRSSAAPSPSIRWVGTLVCTAEVQRHQQDPSATILTSRWGFHCLRVTAQTFTSTQQSTVGLFVYICVFPVLICVLFWFVLFCLISFVLIWWCWFADEVKFVLLVLGLGLMLVFYRESVVIGAVLLICCCLSIDLDWIFFNTDFSRLNLIHALACTPVAMPPTRLFTSINCLIVWFVRCLFVWFLDMIALILLFALWSECALLSSLCPCLHLVCSCC